jgi:putative acyl-CoA dehydrogenase
MNHTVANQVPLFEGRNLFTSDPFLHQVISKLTGDTFEELLTKFGAESGTKARFEAGRLANENTPTLKTFDRVGNRINEVEYDSSYHDLMRFSMANGLHTSPWSDPRRGRLVARCAQNYMMAQVEAGHGCPITMTFAAVPALKNAGGVGETWIPRLLATAYDPRNLPAHQKTACTVGMAMTEKQGGSDVRANQTIATAQADGSFRLDGHKWFCSAPMSDIFLTLAQLDNQLTCFLVPRWDAQDQPNRMHLQRLKDKVGNRSNASSEIEYHGAFAHQLGKIGRGVPTIIEMVTHTRLDCVVASASNIRLAAAHAIHHAQHRKAFGLPLFEQPVMRSVLADLSLEAMAATAMAFEITNTYELDKVDKNQTAFARLCTAIGKYWICKRAPIAVTEAMECHGGNGFVKPHLMARLYTEAPLNSIWEGSGNVICLDVLRTLSKSPELVDVFLAHVRRGCSDLEQSHPFIESLACRLRCDTPSLEARRIVEEMALLLQAGALRRFSNRHIAESFVRARMTDRGLGIGALSGKHPIDALIAGVCS